MRAALDEPARNEAAVHSETQRRGGGKSGALGAADGPGVVRAAAEHGVVSGAGVHAVGLEGADRSPGALRSMLAGERTGAATPGLCAGSEGSLRSARADAAGAGGAVATVG